MCGYLLVYMCVGYVCVRLRILMSVRACVVMFECACVCGCMFLLCMRVWECVSVSACVGMCECAYVILYVLATFIRLWANFVVCNSQTPGLLIKKIYFICTDLYRLDMNRTHCMH